MKTTGKTMALTTLLLLAAGLSAEPTTVMYQGRLLDDTGNVVNTGSVQINFILYDALTGGTAIYEDRNAAVSVTDGLYRCVIGDDTTDYSRTTTNFSTALGMATHMEISIGGSTMSPREPFNSQPFVMRANFAPKIITMSGIWSTIWTNQPAGLTEFKGTEETYTRLDLTNANEVRLTAWLSTAGSANAKIRGQYSTDLSTWNYLDGGTGPSININTTGVVNSGWVDLAAAAKADVYLRIVGIDGNNNADPDFGAVTLQFR